MPDSENAGAMASPWHTLPQIKITRDMRLDK